MALMTLTWADNFFNKKNVYFLKNGYFLGKKLDFTFFPKTDGFFLPL